MFDDKNWVGSKFDRIEGKKVFQVEVMARVGFDGEKGGKCLSLNNVHYALPSVGCMEGSF